VFVSGLMASTKICCWGLSSCLAFRLSVRVLCSAHGRGMIPKPDRHHAARLATKGHIKARIAFLQSQVAERAEIDQDYLVEKTKEILRHALTPVRAKDRYGKPTGPEMRQLGAANTAVFNLAKLCGLWIDKKAEMPANLAQELFEAIGAKPMKLIEHDPDDKADGDSVVTSEPSADATS